MAAVCHQARSGLFLIVFALLFASCSNGDLNPLGHDNATETEVETASFQLLNQDRKEKGLPELIWDSQIAEIARSHSRDMRDRNFFSHTNPDGKTFFDRLQTAGIPFAISGENLARTSNVSDPAVTANSEFLRNDGHRENILNPRFVRGGVGVARSGDTYWITQNFIGD